MSVISLQEKAKKATGWMRFCFWLCVLVAAVVAIRRLVILSHPAPTGSSPAARLDAFFASHSGLMVAHLVPALAFVLLIPAFYSPRFREARWVSWLLYAVGVLVGLTAYALTLHLVGGAGEASAIIVFDTLFLYALARSFLYGQSSLIRLKQIWMTAAMGILLGIATMRPIMGMFFASSRLTHLQPAQFFGPAFWLGFCVNTLVVEIWLRSNEQSLFRLGEGVRPVR